MADEVPSKRSRTTEWRRRHAASSQRLREAQLAHAQNQARLGAAAVPRVLEGGRNDDVEVLDLAHTLDEQAAPLDPENEQPQTEHDDSGDSEVGDDNWSDVDTPNLVDEESENAGALDPVADEEDDYVEDCIVDEVPATERSSYISDESDDDDAQMVAFDHASLLQPVVMKPETIAREKLLVYLATMVRHKFSYECLIDLMASENAFSTSKCLPTSKKELWRILGRNDAGIQEEIYCSSCGSYIAPKRKLGEMASCPCGFSIPTKNAKFFVTISLRKQLTHFLSMPGIGEHLKYRENRRKFGHSSISDVYDSDGYKQLPLGPNDFTFTFSTDGCKTSKGGKVNLYPLFVRVNELPPNLRQKFMFLAGIFVDTAEPVMTSFLRPFVKQINSLSSRGVTWSPNGVVQVVSKFYPHCFCVDGKARSQILNMVSHQGYYGCTYCSIKGVMGSGSTMRWPSLPHPDVPCWEDRTDAGMKEAMLESHPSNRVLGHKGPSALMLIDHLDLRRCNATDDLHVIYECAAAHITELICTSKEARVDSEMGHDRLCALLDARMETIKTPSIISRKPGTCSIKNRKQWKGTEWRNWILYYAIPCLQGIISPRYLKPIEHLSYAAYLMSLDVIEHEFLQMAAAGFHEFLVLNQTQYGLEKTKLNLHTLEHVTRSVGDNGNLWCYSTFNFESWNHRVLKTVTSPKGALKQIVVRHLILNSLEHALLSGENISYSVQCRLSDLLQKRKLKNTLKIAENVHLAGRCYSRDLSDEEKQLLRMQGFHDVLPNSVFEHSKIVINGVPYGLGKETSKSDNSIIYSHSDTFNSVLSIVRFNCLGEEKCGIIVKELSVVPHTPFPHAHHFSKLLHCDEDLLHFLRPADVRVPSLKISVLGSTYVVPMTNTFEID